MAADESGSMQQSNSGSSTGFQNQVNAGGQVNQAAQDINQITQEFQGYESQNIGQVSGGLVIGRVEVLVLNQLQGTEAQPSGSETTQAIGPNPYKGLMAFNEADRERYFGRSREIEALWIQFRELHERSERVRLLPIYGPSGSGKSSLARAGLIPVLGKRPLPGRDRARVGVMVPGTKPLQALAGLLARIAERDAMAVGKTREFARELALANEDGDFDGLHRIASLLPEIQSCPLVVLIDQFEEVYSLNEDAEKRDVLIANLLYAAQERSQYVSVILTMRSDFLGETHRHSELNQLFSSQGFLVPSMGKASLEEVIALPAQNAGHPLDDATIQLLIGQTEGREGALPLLQFALTRIWEGLAEGNTPSKTLEKIGGVGGALAGEAQRVYDGLNEAEQAIARRLFLGLVQLGEGMRDTRRRAAVDSLMARADQPEQFHRVMERFTAPGVRLITVSAEASEETAEVTHEALFEHWRELNVWLDGSRDDLRFERRLDEAAAYWQENGKPVGLLWRNPGLGLLRNYNDRLGQQMSHLQLDFFNAAVKRETQQRVVQWIGITVLAGLAAGMTWFGLQSRQATQRALARQWATQSLQVSNPWTASLLALEPLQHWRTEMDDVNHALRENLAKLPLATLNHEAPVWSLSLSSDGKRVATSIGDGTAFVWDVESGERLVTLNHEAPVWSLSFSEDGKRVATVSSDGTAGVWEVESGKHVATLNYESSLRSVSFSADGKRVATTIGDGIAFVWEVESGERLAILNHEAPVWSLSFSEDGKRVATASAGTASVWEVESGKRLATLNHEFSVNSVSLSSDGKHVATASGDTTARVWEVASGDRLATLNHGNYVNSVSLSSDGKRVATASAGTASVWEVESGDRLATLNHEDIVNSVSLSSDGKRVATVSDDGTAGVWEVEGRGRVATLNHEDIVRSVSLSSDGKRVATASDDGTAGVWEVESGRRLATLTHESSVLSVSFSPDGKRVATASSDRTVGVWEVESGRRLATLKHEDSVLSVSFSSDGKRVATASSDDTAGVWEVESGRRLATLKHEDSVRSVSFSSDGKRVATASWDGTAEVWEVESGEHVATFNHGDYVHLVSLSPDEQRVATASRDGTAGVWEVETGERVANLKHEDSVTSVSFSPDGKQVATTSIDGTAGVWEVESGERVATLNHEDSVGSVSFSSDGKRIATTSDGTVSVWEVESGERVVTLNHEAFVSSVSFSSDGKRVATASWDGTAGIHWLWSSDLAKENCKRLHRNLSAVEWKKYHQTDFSQYHLTCKNLPVHPTVLEEARKLAEAGRVKESIKLYRHLLKIARNAEQELDLDPLTKEVEQDAAAVAKSTAEAANK